MIFNCFKSCDLSEYKCIWKTPDKAWKRLSRYRERTSLVHWFADTFDWSSKLDKASPLPTFGIVMHFCLTSGICTVVAHISKTCFSMEIDVFCRIKIWVNSVWSITLQDIRALVFIYSACMWGLCGHLAQLEILRAYIYIYIYIYALRIYI